MRCRAHREPDATRDATPHRPNPCGAACASPTSVRDARRAQSSKKCKVQTHPRAASHARTPEPHDWPRGARSQARGELRTAGGNPSGSTPQRKRASCESGVAASAREDGTLLGWCGRGPSGRGAQRGGRPRRTWTVWSGNRIRALLGYVGDRAGWNLPARGRADERATARTARCPREAFWRRVHWQGRRGCEVTAGTGPVE